MKIGIATTLSVAGILAAGAAAFALNSAVLSDGSNQTSIGKVQSTLVSGAATATTVAVGQVTSADQPIIPYATKVSDTVTTYKVGTAGSVIIDTASGAIKVTDVVPASGWTAEPAMADPNGAIKVHFTNGTTRLEFTAAMKNDAVTTNAITDFAPAPGQAPLPRSSVGAKPSVPQALRGSDDDDEEEHEDHEGRSGSETHDKDDD